MPEGNPLVATAQDDTTAVTGIGIAESSMDLANGISNGDWVEAGLGAVGVGLEVLSMVIDPIGTIASYGVSWLIEHVQPLKDALDWFAGDPPVIRSFSETWANVAAEVGKVAADFTSEVNAGTAGWTGTAADAYRGKAGETADAVAGAGALSDGISAGVMIMGEVVAAVRELVRDMVAEVVGKLISWALEIAATLGLATPLVVGQAVTAVTKVVNRIADLVRKLVKTIGNVTPRIRKVIDKLGEIMAKLGKLGRRADGTTPAGTTPSGTTPSGTTTPDGPSTPDKPTSPDTTSTPDDTGSVNGDGTYGQPGSRDIDSTVDNPQDASQSADRPFCEDDPIDVATGEVVLSQTDVELPGLLPLVFARHHQSEYRSGLLFGPSWASTLDQRVEVGPTHVWLATDDGRLLRYPKPDGTAAVLPDFGPRLPLRRAGDGYSVTHPQRGVTWEFQPVGAEWDARSTLPIAAIRRRAGGEILVDYDAVGMPSRVRHSGGYEVAVDTADGRVTGLRLTSAEQPVTLMRYSYDSTGQLSEVTNSSGAPLRFTYHDDGKLTSWTDRNGVWYRYLYDSEGRATTTIGSGGALNGTFAYGDRQTVHTDTLGNATTYEFNELGQVVRQIDPLGAVTVREWDNHDRLLSITDPLGHTSRYAYDDEGNVTAITRPDGTTVTAEYIEHGLATVVTDPGGGSWVRDYDERGNLVTETDPAGSTTRFEYDERGHLKSAVDPLGSVTRYETNAAGLVTAVTNPLGAKTAHVHDRLGRVTTTTDALGGVTRYGWTVEGKLLSLTRPDGTVERWRYDGEGNQVEHVDALGQSIRTEFTHFDLPAARTTPDGARTAYVYDTELRLVEVVGPHGLRWRYDYDAAGNMVRESDFDGRVLAYTYDAAGRMATRTNGAGETVSYQRDVHGDVVAKHTPAGTSTFDRDPCGRVVRATNRDTEVVYARDGRGRVLAETIGGRTVRTAFDAAGRRVSRETAVGVVSTWDYDSAGKVISLNSAGHSVTFGHDPLGRQVQRAVGDVTMTQSWTASHRLASQVVAAKQPITHRTWRYRPDGYLDAVSDPAGTRQLTLDRRGRIVAVQGQGWSERYDYDVVGNITNAVLPGGDDVAIGPREYAATRLRNAGRTSYVHDQQGRVVQRRSRTLSGQVRLWRYTWDAEDRLTSVVTPDGVTWRYRYDPMGRRIAKQRLDAAGSVVAHTNFTWDGARLVEHVHSTGATTTWEYQPGSVTPVAQIDRDEVDERFYAIVADLVGSPTELVDASGAIAWRRTASLWGQTLFQSGRAACPLRFPGQYHDEETGWHYNYFRYYDPETGRYTAPDPMGLVPSVNPGAYVPNPTRQIDPLGLQGCTTTGDEAKQQALADAGVPPGSEPLEHRMVPSTTPGGRQILDENYQPVYFPEEVYLNDADELIVFQDHYTGHQFGEGGVGDQDPHVHVRPYDNTRNGQVPGAQEHYYYNPTLGRPTPAQ